jgi:hypothetical protein
VSPNETPTHAELPDGQRPDALPDDLRAALANLRQQPVPPGLADRLRALPRSAVAPIRPGLWRRALPIVAPSALAAVIVLHVIATPELAGDHGNGPFIAQEEVGVHLGSDGSAWLDLDLPEMHPAGDRVSVQIHAPDGMQLQVAGEGVAPDHCAADVCRHSFVTAAGPAQPMRLRVHRSGRFAVDVHHRSPQHRGRQRILVHAVDAPVSVLAPHGPHPDAGSTSD